MQVEVDAGTKSCLGLAAQQLRVLIDKNQKTFRAPGFLLLQPWNILTLCAYVYDQVDSYCCTSIDMVWPGPELIARSKERSDG